MLSKCRSLLFVYLWKVVYGQLGLDGLTEGVRIHRVGMDLNAFQRKGFLEREKLILSKPVNRIYVNASCEKRGLFFSHLDF